MVSSCILFHTDARARSLARLQMQINRFIAFSYIVLHDVDNDNHCVYIRTWNVYTSFSFSLFSYSFITECEIISTAHGQLLNFPWHHFLHCCMHCNICTPMAASVIIIIMMVEGTQQYMAFFFLKMCLCVYAQNRDKCERRSKDERNVKRKRKKEERKKKISWYHIQININMVCKHLIWRQVHVFTAHNLFLFCLLACIYACFCCIQNEKKVASVMYDMEAVKMNFKQGKIEMLNEFLNNWDIF